MAAPAPPYVSFLLSPERPWSMNWKKVEHRSMVQYPLVRRLKLAHSTIALATRSDAQENHRRLWTCAARDLLYSNCPLRHATGYTPR